VRALERPASDDVAIRHYEWLKTGLLRHGLDVTPYNIALAWNGGLAAAVRGSVPAAARDYAERVTNIAQELRRAQLASIHSPPRRAGARADPARYSRKEACLGAFAARRAASSSGVALRWRGGRATRLATAAS
jgi:hypothetical protein